MTDEVINNYINQHSDAYKPDNVMNFLKVTPTSSLVTNLSASAGCNLVFTTYLKEADKNILYFVDLHGNMNLL